MIKTINYTSQFKKDIEKAKKQNRNLKILQYVIELLTISSPLPMKFRDHKLSGRIIRGAENVI